MLALLHLAGAALLGACVTRRALRGAVGVWEQALWGLLAGWMLAATATYAAARWQGRLTWWTVAGSTALVWACAASLALAPRGGFGRLRGRLGVSGLRGWLGRRGLDGARGLFDLREPVGRRRAGLAVVLAASAPVYWRLFSSHTFAEGPGGLYSGGSAWYDLSFHAALAASFVYGENFPPAYTPLAGEPLLYPFMPDFHAAALMAAGLSLRAAFLATALPLALAATGVFYSFALRLARGASAAALATALFLLNGGLGFVELARDWRQSGLGLLELWGALPSNYANDWARGIHWTNLVADTFLPQRASLYGLPAGLVILTAFAIYWRREKEGGKAEGVRRKAEDTGLKAEAVKPRAQDGGLKAECRRREAEGERREAEGGRRKGEDRSVSDEGSAESRPFILQPSTRLLLFAGVLAGMLPVFHTHTYVAVGLVSGFLFLMRPRRAWVAFWAPAVLLAAPQLLELARRAAEVPVVRWQPGWMGADAPSFAVYMLRNFGPPLLLAVPAWLAAPRAWKTFYVAFALLLAFALTVVVSPNVFDNGKLTYYWHAANSALVARWLVSLASVRRLRLPAAALALLLALLSVASGAAALRFESRAAALLFADADIEAARFVREATPPRALFLTAPAFNHPALALAGRRVVRGPTSWLWGHGHEFRAREADVRSVYAGAPDAVELLRHYGVDYVYLGAAERDALKADAAFFDSLFPPVYRAAGVAVYDVRAVTGGSRAHGGPEPRELAARVGRDPFALLEEFPRAGLFVCRMLEAALGREPRREEFLDGMRALGGGLRVGAAGWELKLAENRRALAARLAGGDAARGAALLDAAGARADARAYDAAYVRVHFFAYLGRDPDPEGFRFWLDVLTRTGDYRSISRAFMESDEHRQSRER